LLIQGGDIEVNPGPDHPKKTTTNKRIIPKCPICEKSVKSNNKQLICKVCFDRTHVLCTGISVFVKRVKSSAPCSWICQSCTLAELPFYGQEFSSFFNADHTTEPEPTLRPTQELDCNSLLQPTDDIHLEVLKNKANQLRLFHLNTQSMTSTFNEFLLTVKRYPFDVLTLSETWLKDNEDLLKHVSIPGFTFEYRNRESIRGGGVGAYIKESVVYKRRRDIENLQPELEHMWLEFKGRNKHSKLLLGVFYRSTRILSTKAWFNKFESLLGHISGTWDSLLTIAGDMNIDLLNSDASNTKQYNDILQSFNLHQHVNKPTRITSSSRSLIDHIISSHPNRITHTDVLPCSIASDHDGSYACINIRVERFRPRYKYIRYEKQFDQEAFLKDFSTLPLSLIYSTNDPNDQLDMLNKLFNECLERHAPLRKEKITRPPAPWLKTNEIPSNMLERNRLRTTAHTTNSDNDWKAFRTIRNKIRIMIRQAKQQFVEKALSSKRPKEIWRVIHRILRPCQKPLRFDVNALNEHFVNTGQRTMGKSPNDIQDLTRYIDSLTTTDDSTGFRLQEISVAEVHREIKKLRTDCSTGPDNISTKYIKIVADFLAGPITQIINNSIQLSIFPDNWKVSRISPIPKVNNPTCFDDLRPIAILPVLSKIFERVVANQLVKHLEQQGSFYEGIVGYRKGHSTMTALLKIRDDIIKAMKKGEVTLMVLADFSKAFDTVNFMTVLHKMSNLGFSRSFMHWIMSYLSERRQYVQIDDNTSESLTVQFGMPQGSILGPLIFNIYVTDLHQSLAPNTSCIQYADDTTMYVHSSVAEIPNSISSLTASLNNLDNWSSRSNLSLNPKKTETMLFSTSQLARVHSLGKVELDLEISGRKLKKVAHKKLLGINIEQHLQWNEHVKSVISSCFSTLSTLKKIRNFANFNLRKHLAESLILSKLDYNDIVFEPLQQYLLKRLQCAQNAAASFVTGRYATAIDCVKLGWLPMEQRRKHHLLNAAYKALHDPLWPSYASIEKANPSRTLRSSKSLSLTIPLIKGTFQDRASNTFNQLPAETRNSVTLRSFSGKTKTLLMNEAKLQLKD
jgi:exonuclease III